MTISIEIAPYCQRVLEEEAARLGKSPAQLADELLNELLEDLTALAEDLRHSPQINHQNYWTLNDIRKSLGR